MQVPSQVDAEIGSLLGRLEQLVSANDDDPRHRLLAALIAMWNDGRPVESRFEAARHLLTLDQRDVWFVADDPVAALDDAASRLLVALGDAITAAGANFYFDAGEPFTPAGRADDAYAELGEAIRHWKAEVLDEQRRLRTGSSPSSRLRRGSEPSGDSSEGIATSP